MNSRSETRLFFLSFSAAFFLIALLFLFMVTVIHPRTPQSLQADATTKEAYVPNPDDALTLLLIGTETPDTPAGTFVLLRFDPVSGQVLVASLPPETALFHNGKTESLSDAYRFGGAIYTKNALAASLNLPIDRYARITLNSFILSAGAVGTVEFALQEDVTLMEGEVSVTLNEGVQLLDGRKVAGLLRREADDPAKRSEFNNALICAVINQRIDVVRSTLIDKVFETVINLVDTDISSTDYELRKEAALQMSYCETPVAKPVLLTGQWDGALFYLHDTSLVQLARGFL